MYKYVCGVLQAFVDQHPSCKNSLHTSNSGNTGKPGEPNGIFKPNKVESLKLKKLDLPKKKKIFLLYKTLWDRLVTPLVELVMPGLKTADQLTRLSDFRTHHGFQQKSDDCGKTQGKTCLKCSEEPKLFNYKKTLEIEDCVIKDPLDIMKSHKNFRDLKKLSKNNNKNDNRIFINNDQPKSSKTPLFYDFLLKKFIESKIAASMPNLNNDKLLQLCDFRQNEELDCELDGEQEIIKKRNKVITASIDVNNTNLNIEKNNLAISNNNTQSCDIKIIDTINEEAGHFQETPSPIIMAIPMNDISNGDTKLKLGKNKNKTIDTLKRTTKHDNITVKIGRPHINIKAQIKVKPSIKKVLKKENLRQDVIKKLHKINGTTQEKIMKGDQVKIVTAGVKKKPIINNTILSNEPVKSLLSNSIKNDSMLIKKVDETNNETDIKKKHIDDNISFSKYQNKETVENVSNEHEDKITTSDNMETIEVITTNVNASDNLLKEEESVECNDHNSQYKTRLDEKECAIQSGSKQINNNILLKSCGKTERFSQNSLKSDLQKSVQKKHVSPEALNDTKVDEEKCDFVMNLTNEEKGGQEEMNQSITSTHNKTSPESTYRPKYVWSSNKIDNKSPIQETTKEINNIVNQGEKEIILDIRKTLKEKKPINSFIKEVGKEYCVKSNLKTHLVSFQTNDDEGFFVKKEHNIGDLININNVIEKENDKFSIARAKENVKTQEKGIKNKENLNKTWENSNHFDKTPLKSWKKGKSELGQNAVILKVKEQKSSIPPHSSTNIKENSSKQPSSLLNVNKDINFSSSTVKNVCESQNIMSKTHSLESIKAPANQDIVGDPLIKVANVKSKSSITIKNSHPRKRILSEENESKNTDYKIILKDTKIIKSDDYKSSKNEPGSNLKVLKEVKLESSKDRSNNDTVTEHKGMKSDNIESMNDNLKRKMMRGKSTVELNSGIKKETTNGSVPKNETNGESLNKYRKQHSDEHLNRLQNESTVTISSLTKSNKNINVSKELGTANSKIQGSQNGEGNTTLSGKISSDSVTGSIKIIKSKNINTSAKQSKESLNRSKTDLMQFETKPVSKTSSKIVFNNSDYKTTKDLTLKSTNNKSNILKHNQHAAKNENKGNITKSLQANYIDLGPTLMKMANEHTSYKDVAGSKLNAGEDIAQKEQFKVKMSELLKTFTVTGQNCNLKIEVTKTKKKELATSLKHIKKVSLNITNILKNKVESKHINRKDKMIINKNINKQQFKGLQPSKQLDKVNNEDAFKQRNVSKMETIPHQKIVSEKKKNEDFSKSSITKIQTQTTKTNEGKIYQNNIENNKVKNAINHTASRLRKVAKIVPFTKMQKMPAPTQSLSQTNKIKMVNNALGKSMEMNKPNEKSSITHISTKSNIDNKTLIFQKLMQKQGKEK